MGLILTQGKQRSFQLITAVEKLNHTPIFTSKASKGCNLIDALEQESNQGEKKGQVHNPNPAQKQLEVAFVKYLDLSVNYLCETDDLVTHLTNEAKTMKYTARDLELFTLQMVKFEDRPNFEVRAGLFLSLLINISNEADFIIHTSNLSKPINSIGYKNTKNIIVNGDVGSCLGERMIDGSIVLNGNAGDFLAAKQESGTIIVNGNIGKNGCYMSSGTVTIYGNCGQKFGNCVHGGKISVFGNVEKFAFYELHNLSEIFINGNLDERACLKMDGGKVTINGNVGPNLASTSLVESDSGFAFSATGGEIIVNGGIASLGDLWKSRVTICQYDVILVKDGERIADPMSK
jgi:hypothetical protein